jgi:hypothetical protein
MRAVHYLAGSAIAALFAISVALVVRDFPAGKPAPQQAETPPQAEAPTAPPALPEPPVAREPAPIPAEPLPLPARPEPPAPAQNAKPGNLFDLQSMPSPGYIGPGAPPPLQSRAPEQKDAASSDRGAARTRLQLTPEQTAKVSYVLLSHTITQTEAAEFPLRVGGTVPPDIVLTPLPRDVADAVPGYEHYSYIIAQYQIVIVVTARREIDLVIPI